MAYDINDYVQVNERIEKFYQKYPEGSIQSEVVTDLGGADGGTKITVKAYAYRSPDDQRPGTGHSWLEIPGKTNFTRGSELENAETSAWGRALAALGFEVKKSIASAEEVAAKASDVKPGAIPTDNTAMVPGGLTAAQKKLLQARMTDAGLKGRQRNGLLLTTVSKGDSKSLNVIDLDKVLDALQNDALIAQIKAEFEE